MLAEGETYNDWAYDTILPQSGRTKPTAAVDNAGSNAISARLGYERNGTAWATHQGKPVLGQRWLLSRQTWIDRRREDITMTGVEECRAVLGR